MGAGVGPCFSILSSLPLEFWHSLFYYFNILLAAYRGQLRGHRGTQAWTAAKAEGSWGPWTWRLPGTWRPRSQQARACLVPRRLTFQCCLPSCCGLARSSSRGVGGGVGGHATILGDETGDLLYQSQGGNSLAPKDLPDEEVPARLSVCVCVCSHVQASG